MTMTSLALTSSRAIRPSGDSLDLVKPGMLRVVGTIREFMNLKNSGLGRGNRRGVTRH
jgi:hypothetical protein